MVKRVGGLTDDRRMSIGIRRGSVDSFRTVPILARQIRRDDRVGYSAMGMTGLTVVMVRLRVNMDQRNGQHPNRQPREDHQACPQHIREHLWHESVHLDLARTVAQAVNRVKCRHIS